MGEVIIKGSSGRIEGKYFKSRSNTSPIALILHPHPMHGGTMDNKVVFNMYKTFANFGFTVLRINFAGVGRSEGSFDNGIGELIDSATALDWLESENPKSEAKIVAGFSFGAWIALQLIMRRPEITEFVVAAPPVNKYDFSFLSPCPISGLVLQGDYDSVVSEESVRKFTLEVLSKHKNIDITYKVIKGGDHFFRNKIDELNKNIEMYLSSVLPELATFDDISPSDHDKNGKMYI